MIGARENKIIKEKSQENKRKEEETGKAAFYFYRGIYSLIPFIHLPQNQQATVTSAAPVWIAYVASLRLNRYG